MLDLFRGWVMFSEIFSIIEFSRFFYVRVSLKLHIDNIGLGEEIYFKPAESWQRKS